MKVIITGTTGMVGEGVLLECLQNKEVSEVLNISRKTCGIKNPKLKELLVSDFFEIENYAENLKDYDACFYCVGKTSAGMTEADYTKLTYDTTIHFCKCAETIKSKHCVQFRFGQKHRQHRKRKSNVGKSERKNGK